MAILVIVLLILAIIAVNLFELREGIAGPTTNWTKSLIPNYARNSSTAIIVGRVTYPIICQWNHVLTSPEVKVFQNFCHLYVEKTGHKTRPTRNKSVSALFSLETTKIEYNTGTQ